MSNVLPLRKRSTSYYAVRRAGREWAVVLVTPVAAAAASGALRTALSYFPTRDGAISTARSYAVKALLPFRDRGHEVPQ